ncbi:cysteine desulfurase [Azospirillum sp. RWY-5-1]|uniref:cysteine desulfurase n=1 Tax=Azospirillum oleiclasticum TaxID=2735135 RepID=A0ABX2T529_9PROT|nr:cysteine desulfurase [Azospirillum oleiclasticum]NYZ11131.1 cysteine desulfurase [Azospirillum oleiclasticum]NYZ18293.1 cysteine desulfurase [Azospirillum oleiclasticum]
MPDMITTATTMGTAFDVEAVRADFPILARSVHAVKGRPGKPLVFLDSAASAQKPRAVIDAMSRFMEEEYANVHRGVHYLSQRATDRFEEARRKVARFLNAPGDQCIVFTRNATEAFNLIASSYGRTFLERGDEVVVSVMEHHANIVPWQLLQAAKGIVIRVVPVGEDGSFDLDAYAGLLNDRTKLVSITHCSNVLGTVTPAKEIARLAHERGIPVAFDGSQAVVHGPVDVQDIDADFYAFTAHKLYGPTGLGVLYGKREILKRMPPYQGGGEMIQTVSFEGTTFKEPPMRFEAGTPPITETVGLSAAIDYVEALGREAIAAHEHDLLAYATERLQAIDGVRIYGTAPGKGPILSFTVDGLHPHDLGTIVDQYGVAVRVGRHCAEPLMDRFGVGATARASFALYNTRAEADALAESVIAAKEFFGA